VVRYLLVSSRTSQQPATHPRDRVLRPDLGAGQQLSCLHDHGGLRTSTAVGLAYGTGNDRHAQEEVTQGLDWLLRPMSRNLLHALEEDGGNVSIQVTPEVVRGWEERDEKGLQLWLGWR
jgi:hypothetical protein